MFIKQQNQTLILFNCFLTTLINKIQTEINELKGISSILISRTRISSDLIVESCPYTQTITF